MPAETVKREILRAPKGCDDLLPEESPDWARLESQAREVFARYGYKEIRPPLLEPLDLFQRGIGEATDIVEKEMYALTLQGGEKVALRPEGTAGVVRAYLEHEFPKRDPFQKLYYVGPMFRFENVQENRKRQFHQVGVEALGSVDPLLDVETILLACDVLGAWGLKGFEVEINTVGCPACRPAMREKLKGDLSPRLADLCENCRSRHARNVFRILDCKNETCRRIVKESVRETAHGAGTRLDLPICAECIAHWQFVSENLHALGAPVKDNPFLVRGLDYYTRTVFEITHFALGARNAVGAGGRYDTLVPDLGGPEAGAVGFALGVEASLNAMRKTGARPPVSPPPLDAFLVSVGRDPALRSALARLLQELRRAGLSAEMDYEAKSVKGQMRRAGALNARAVLILGPDEAAAGQITVKDMASGQEARIPLSEAGEAVRKAPR